MVKTRAGLSTGPNENMVVSEELKSYPNEQFDSLADKNDISAMKEEVMALIINVVKEQGDKISALETRLMCWKRRMPCCKVTFSATMESRKPRAILSQIVSKNRWNKITCKW